jgi:hypothetical protein
VGGVADLAEWRPRAFRPEVYTVLLGEIKTEFFGRMRRIHAAQEKFSKKQLTKFKCYSIKDYETIETNLVYFFRVTRSW